MGITPKSNDKRLRTSTGKVHPFMNNQSTNGTSNNKPHQNQAKNLDAAITTWVITGSSASKSLNIFSKSGTVLSIRNDKTLIPATATSNVTKKQAGWNLVGFLERQDSSEIDTDEFCVSVWFSDNITAPRFWTLELCADSSRNCLELQEGGENSLRQNTGKMNPVAPAVACVSGLH